MKKTMIFRALFLVAAVSVQLGGPPDALSQTGNETLSEGARLIVGDGCHPGSPVAAQPLTGGCDNSSEIAVEKLCLGWIRRALSLREPEQKA